MIINFIFKKYLFLFFVSVSIFIGNISQMNRYCDMLNARKLQIRTEQEIERELIEIMKENRKKKSLKIFVDINKEPINERT